MKRLLNYFSLGNHPSPPIRGRGLKHRKNKEGVARPMVAPHTGAWIETLMEETPEAAPTSPPIRGRGLKQGVGCRGRGSLPSPPIRGRGLKRFYQGYTAEMVLSPPIRGRGLKPYNGFHRGRLAPSPPIRGRGLKRAGQNCAIASHRVAPHTGAWIETRRPGKRSCCEIRRPPYGGVD